MKSVETIRIYLNQLHEIPMLTAEEEKKLFNQMNKGGKKGEEARMKLIESNLPLVVSLAKRYYYPAMNIEFLNFIEEGNIGLVKSVKKFDVTKGFKFSTYASWWIEKHFQSAALKSRSIVQVPEKTWINLKKIENTINRLLHETGQAPDMDELTKKIDLSILEVRDILQSTLKIKNIKSLDYFLDAEGTRTLGDIVTDEDASVDSMLNDIFEKQQIEEMLNVLDERERKVIELRFGLDGKKNHTYEEIAEKLGISAVKAIDLQKIAIKKLQRTRPLDERGI
ncbi:RNA polymerase sigma factor RpoD/SigA [Elusimicrobiota bacterium]